MGVWTQVGGGKGKQQEWVGLGMVLLIPALIYALFHIVPLTRDDISGKEQRSQQATISRFTEGSCRFRKLIKTPGKVN